MTSSIIKIFLFWKRRHFFDSFSFFFNAPIRNRMKPKGNQLYSISDHFSVWGKKKKELDLLIPFVRESGVRQKQLMTWKTNANLTQSSRRRRRREKRLTTLYIFDSILNRKKIVNQPLRKHFHHSLWVRQLFVRVPEKREKKISLGCRSLASINKLSSVGRVIASELKPLPSSWCCDIVDIEVRCWRGLLCKSSLEDKYFPSIEICSLNQQKETKI